MTKSFLIGLDISITKWTMIGLLQLLFVACYGQGNVMDPVASSISEERFVSIKGLQMWVTIKGDRTKPAVLFIHGGPGSPLSPYANAIYGPWEKDFILIQWDQRGAGKTYGQNAPDELTPDYLRSNPLTIEQMTADGLELARYLIKYLGKQKLILFGSSWGSVLGVRMAQESPELFHAYIGHSQVVNPAASDLSAYHTLVKLAQKSNDQISLDLLHRIGQPPYDTARNSGMFMRVVKNYQQKNALPAPPTWFVMPPEYDNQKDNQHRGDGDDYSFVYYVGDKRLGIAPMNTKINLLEDALTFDIPVFFIQGEEDIQTPPAVIRAYFDKIKAPSKKIFMLPNTEHGFNQSVIDVHMEIMKNYIVPPIVKQKESK